MSISFYICCTLLVILIYSRDMFSMFSISLMHCLIVSWNIFFSLLIIAKILLLQHNQHFLPWRFGLYQRPSSEEVCSIPLPVLATIVMWRGKKSVVRVAQHVAPLIPVQGLPSFFPNMYCLFDPSSTFVGFSVQNSGGRPIDHVVVMICIVTSSHHYCGKNWKRNWTNFFWWRSLIETEMSR